MYNPYSRYNSQDTYNRQQYSPYGMYNGYEAYPDNYETNAPTYKGNVSTRFGDYGPEPFAINIEEITKRNNTFRTALWTGDYIQLTLMSIDVGEDIGLEMHPDVDQFIRIEDGRGLVMMGDNKDLMDFRKNVTADFAVIIPAGKWHNLINTGNMPLKLYSIYAPPQHPHGTVHETKEAAEAYEDSYRR